MRIIGLIGLLALLVGCAGPVQLPDPSGPRADSAQCRAVMANLPPRVAQRSRRESRPADSTAAWGDPPITVRCGVAKPAALTPTSQCFEVNGIGWLAEPQSRGVLFTTIGREPHVEVAVPNEYEPAADALVDLSDAVSKTHLIEPCA